MNGSIYETARKGLPLKDILVIDGHCHIGPVTNFTAPANSAEGMLESMDALGIGIACISAHASIGPDYILGNDLVMKTVSTYPDRFVGYAVVNPNYPEDISCELERCFACSGMLAVKLHPSFHGSAIDNKNYSHVYEIADQRHLTVLIHTWGRAEIAAVDRISGEYPGANFIAGHSGGEIKAMEDTIELVNKRKNVFADLTLSVCFEGGVEWFVREMGADKVLFGSDTPFLDPKPSFGRVAMAEISDKDKEKILGLNMKRLLKL